MNVKQKRLKFQDFFRPGDIVKNESVWGKRFFVVDHTAGNSYCPIVVVHPWGERLTASSLCNFMVEDTELVRAKCRPLQKLNIRLLLKLYSKGNREAKREFLIRNYKKYV